MQEYLRTISAQVPSQITQEIGLADWLFPQLVDWYPRDAGESGGSGPLYESARVAELFFWCSTLSPQCLDFEVRTQKTQLHVCILPGKLKGLPQYRGGLAVLFA